MLANSQVSTRVSFTTIFLVLAIVVWVFSSSWLLTAMLSLSIALTYAMLIHCYEIKLQRYSLLWYDKFILGCATLWATGVLMILLSVSLFSVFEAGAEASFIVGLVIMHVFLVVGGITSLLVPSRIPIEPNDSASSTNPSSHS